VLAVFGGSFNPPHMGHALIPEYLLARGLADRVLVVPCYQHALGKSLMPFDLRVSLTRLALGARDQSVEVSDLEEGLARTSGRPSYSIELLEAVAARHPGVEVRLVVGSDIVSTGETERWHRWDRIEAEFSPIVIPRAGYAHAERVGLPEVSSTRVRELLEVVRAGDGAEAEAAREDLEHLIPARVLTRVLEDSAGHVLLVGGGHVAHHARGWLVDRGFDVTQLGGRALVAGDGEAEVRDGEFVGAWILCSDPAIGEVARSLSEAGWPAEVPVLHAAGARVASSAMPSLVERGVPVGTLHPVCSLRKEMPRSLLAEAGFGLEGDEAAREFARRLVGEQLVLDLGGLDARGREAYHGACALVANHLGVLWRVGSEVLTAQGHGRDMSERVLATLLRSSLDNLLALGIPLGITGPVARGDLAAVERHLQALDEDPAELYRLLSSRLREMLSR
jgi:nicotinate-nucleotide adenylyltransferase